jgi:membrane-associated phospholipid phosphatase
MLRYYIMRRCIFKVGVFIFTVTLLLSASGVAAQATRQDLDVLVEMMEHRKIEPTEFFQQISNSTNYVGMLVPMSVLATGYARGDKTIIQKGWFMAETLVASSLVTLGLKYSLRRNRPFNIDPFIIPADSGGSPSFPSGHTSEAFATATSLTLAWPKWWVAIPAYTWAGSVGYSRMYLGVHYPTDVMAGAVVGAASAWLMYKANKWLHHNNTAALCGNTIY